MNDLRIEKLKKNIIEKLVPLIDRDYVLLDVPNHRNIGDNLIWEGELVFLKKYVSCSMNYSSNVWNCDLNCIGKNDVIIFHGGGNIGDLYPECQKFRLAVSELFRNNRIIIFPQTVYYCDLNLLKSDCAILNEHPDLYICVRDQVSYNLLSKYLSEEKLLLLPDMAFFVDMPFAKIQTGNQLFLKRTDLEKNSISLFDTTNIDVSDWPTYSNNKYLRIFQLVLIRIKINLSIRLQHIPLVCKLVDPRYGLNLRNNRCVYIKRGILFLSKYDVIYTTRLHGLILGILLNKKVVIIDNSYGKSTSFYHTWLEDFENVTLHSN